MWVIERVRDFTFISLFEYAYYTPEHILNNKNILLFS